jgi:hypothetical protein
MVQYVGSKTWLFFSSPDYNSNNGFRATSYSKCVFQNQQLKHHPVKLSNSFRTQVNQAICLFQESWAHMVLTQAGSNILINYRQFSIINVIRDPVMFVHILFNRFSHLDKIEVANKVKPLQTQDIYIILYDSTE